MKISKISKYFPFLMLIVALTFNACSNESEISNSEEFNHKSNSFRYTASDFEYIEIEHNRVVESYLNNLNIDELESKQELVDFSTTFIKREVHKFESIQSDHDLADQLIDEYFGSKALEQTDYYSHLDEEIKSQLTEDVKSSLDILHEILINADSEPVALQSEIANWENNAYENEAFVNKDLSILFVASSIARNSYELWYNSDFLKQQVVEKNGGDRAAVAIGVIAGVDVTAGVGAAATTWYINVFAPPPAGQAAYGTAIVGAAIGASTAAAVGAIFGAIFDLW
jgi:hypothetical protein